MYVREIDDQVLTLQVSGKLWMRSLVMIDAETKTEWAHLPGKGMAGKFKDRKLKPIISDMVTWDVWKKQHPETTVLNMSETVKGYTREFYQDPSRFVFGFQANGNHYALPMPQLMKHPVHSFQVEQMPLLATFDKAGAVTHLFDRVVDRQPLDFRSVDESLMADEQTNSRWEKISGRCVSGRLKNSLLKQRVGIVSFRKAWDNFHPDSKDVIF